VRGVLQREFDRQLDNLLAKGYPELAGTSREAFVEQVAPLEQRLSEAKARANGSAISFVIVVKGTLVSTEQAMSRIELGGKEGFVRMHPTEPAEYAAIDGLDVPRAPAYLAVDLDTGGTTLNVTPDDALGTISTQGRSPLTIDEGVAVVTHHPELLRTRNAFSILGSRRGDRRVPAIWVSGGAPRLGWCWAGNPHSWLGSASCGARVAAH
jgi:Family of unknown function (DUF5701)